jgi:hypothetical protein
MEGGVMPSYGTLVMTKASEVAVYGKKEWIANERGYRRGYWDGVLAACNLISNGSTQHTVRLWLFRELKEWVSDSRDDECSLDYPPECPPKRSEHEADVGPFACVPSASPGCSYCYAIGDGHGYVKIGAADDVRKRIKQLQTGNPNKLYLIAFVRLQSRHAADCVERAAHLGSAADRVHGEWFSMSDSCSVQALLEACLECGHDVSPVEVESRVY